MTSTGVDTRGAQEGQESQEKRPLRAAAVPRRPAGVGFLGMLLALAVAALGVLGIYEAAVLLVDVVDGDPLLTPFLTGPATVDQEVATAAVAGLAVLAGLWLLWTALRPGRRSGVEVGAGTGVWMTYGDLERLASAAAGRCDGV
ncbi:MAG TPA: hypothetical protein VFD41_10995, partial [Actinomycetales bacterium]|nr:hypothetical protein [Actinomycetales bacterium]